MRIKKTYLITAALVCILAAIVYQILFGKLFPYSPVKIGFTRHELSNVVVYVQDGTEFNDFNSFDSYIPYVEKYHELKFRKRPVIIIFDDKRSYLQRSVTKARFCAYPNGSIVVSPWAVKESAEGKISLEIYLRHELSHALLYQHMGIVNAYFNYPRWLLEGVAVCSSNQMGTSWYPSKEETYADIRNGSFMPPDFFKTKREDGVKLNVKYRITFMYSEFACIVDYMVQAYGKEKFLQYMKGLLSSSDHDRIFKEIYGIDFENFLQDFKKYIGNRGKHEKAALKMLNNVKKACYWKNEIHTDLSNGENSEAWAIAVSNGTVYLAGFYSIDDDNHACIWINNQRLDLNDGGKMSEASAIAIRTP